MKIGGTTLQNYGKHWKGDIFIMISVAMLSRWHVHANDYAKQAAAHPDLQIAAVWDEDPARGRAWAEELKVPFYERLDALLSETSIEGVIVDTPTNLHKDVIPAAARAKKHIFTEKVLGLTVGECDEIFRAVDAAGVKLMVSLRRLTNAYYTAVQGLVDEGALGYVTLIRCRDAHNGAVPSEARPDGWLPGHFFDPVACGGGALIDLGAHPIYLVNRLGGEALSVTARFTRVTGHQVEDNAVVLVEFATGALGVIETGFVSSGSPFLLEVHGTTGTAIVEGDRVRARCAGRHDGEWFDVTLPPAPRWAMSQWVDDILGRALPSITREDVRRLTAINQAAAESDRTGQRVDLARFY